ncbi:MAG: M23 family metallopeptidase [Hyphomonadaceae bacterium]|nr:M23 family metallopeptidase [Hyphomonadaceae bacterium]
MTAFGLMAGAAVVGLALAWNAGLFSGSAQAAATESAQVREEAAKRAELQAFTEVYLAHEAREMRVGNGETLAGLLSRAGASRAETHAALASISGVYNPRQIRPGQPISLFFDRRGGDARLTGIAFRSEPGASVTANRTSTGFAAREVQMPVTFEMARIAAPVETTLYGTALRLGATDREVAALADAFAYDVDFQRDVRPGDNFELVFERYFDDEGNTVRTGDLLFVGLESSRGSRAFYQFLAPGDSRPDWYDAQGHSARRFLMKTPINGARLSSGFGMRRHPVLGYSAMHRGTDFAAPIGTPILAAGEGTVVRAGPFSSFGNYVRIRHANGYETAYAHMSRFAGGLRAGTRVRQGQVIGYVGTTGRSTGPHLHYEVLLRGRQMNPMALRVANGRNLEGRALELFMIERERIDTLRQVRARETPDAARAIPASASAPAASIAGN